MSLEELTFPLEAVSGRNLTFSMLNDLGRSIVTGRYDKDAFPTEAELATQYGVSRSVVREAVKMLGAKGLLTARPRKGTTVRSAACWNLFDTDVLRWILERKFSLQLLRQFTELRVAIEPAAAQLAAQTRDPDLVKAISAGYDRMVAADHGDDDPLESDIAFHIAILQASANPIYMQFRELVTTALRTSIRFTNRFNNRTADLPQHRAVLTAIEQHDGEAASAAMRSLIVDVMTLIGSAERSS